MNKASLSQRINPKSSPPFWEMDDSTFEHFSRSLMHEDEHIKYAELYGLRGEKQYGIDIEAERKDGGIDVGQCKCYKAFSHRQISKAATEFIKYWEEVWGSRDVRRFILLVACELSSKKQRDEIAKWKKKFAQIGVEFEAWSNDVIRDKLRPHRGIVTDYLGDFWALKICGQSLRGATPKSSSEITASADAKIERFTAIANSSAQKELDQINSLISSGKAASALRQLESLKSDDSLWSLLEKETQAKVLRIEGALRLEESDGLHSTKALADEAEKLFKSDGPSQLRSLIAWKEKGPEAALETIGEAVTVKDRLFKAGILLALEKYSQVEDELYDITSNKDDIANMWRLRSLVHLAQGSLGAALKSIRKAKEAVPDSYIIKYIEGGLSFYSALSPAACPQQLLTYSDPIDWLWVRRDDTSQSSLRFSEQIFVDIEDACELTEEQRLHVQSWQLACLACQPNRTEEAEEYCRSLLSTDRTNPHAIAWAVNRGYFSDQVLQKSYVALEEELELVPSVSTIISLCVLCLRFGTQSEAISLLEGHKSLFKKKDLLSLWQLWRVQVAAPEEVTSGKYAGVVEPASRTELAILEQQVDVSSDYSAIVEKGKLALNGELPTVILADVCHFLAKHRHWDFFTDNALDIIERLQTAPAVDMVVSACYETGKHQDVLTILDKHKSSFPNSQLPPSLKRLKLLAQRSQGMLPDALHEARILARQTGLLEDYMMVANLCLEKGDVDSVQRVVAEVRAKQGLPPEGALHFSRVLAPHEPEFAKELFQDAVSSGLNPKNISEAYFLAQQIGILEQYESLAASFIAQVQDGSTVNVKAITSIEEIKEVVAEQQRGAAERKRLYAKGRGALHFLLGGVNSTMAFCFHQLRKHAAQIDDLISAPSLLIRHGGRPILDQFPESLDGVHLYMDITALVLSHGNPPISRGSEK